MPTGSTGDEQEGELPPPGSRWGAGAGSVLPYLTKSLQARPAHGQETREIRARELQDARQQQPTAPAP